MCLWILCRCGCDIVCVREMDVYMNMNVLLEVDLWMCVCL